MSRVMPSMRFSNMPSTLSRHDAYSFDGRSIKQLMASRAGQTSPSKNLEGSSPGIAMNSTECCNEVWFVPQAFAILLVRRSAGVVCNSARRGAYTAPGLGLRLVASCRLMSSVLHLPAMAALMLLASHCPFQG